MSAAAARAPAVATGSNIINYRRDPVFRRAAEDWYVEERWAVDALFDAEAVVGRVGDPACGGGQIPEAARARGHEAIGADLVDRGWPGTELRDFLDVGADGRPEADADRLALPGVPLPGWPDGHVDTLISNPPFKPPLPLRFIWRARAVARFKVVLFLPLAFLEGIDRKAMFEETGLSRVLVCSSRVSCPPGGAAIRATGGKKAYGWFVWERGWRGPPQIGFIIRPGARRRRGVWPPQMAPHAALGPRAEVAP